MSVCSRCRCQALVLLFFATERGARVNIPLRQNAGVGRLGISSFPGGGGGGLSARHCGMHSLEMWFMSSGEAVVSHCWARSTHGPHIRTHF